MALLHIHFHPNFRYIPHLQIEGYDSLEDEINKGNIYRAYRKKDGSEFLAFTNCSVCRDNKKWFAWIRTHD